MRLMLPLILLSLFACEGLEVRVAEPCLTSEECVDGAVCFDSPGDVALCMETCAVDVRLCEGGEVCIPVASDEENVCYLGGVTEIGNTCVDSSVCVAGSVCIVEGDTGTCRAACDTRNPTCPAAGDVCTETTAPAGFCLPAEQ